MIEALIESWSIKKKSLRVAKAIVEKEIYLLKKLDDSELNDIFAKNRIKKFHQRVELSKSAEIKIDVKERINEKLTHLKELISKEWSFVVLISFDIEEALF